MGAGRHCPRAEGKVICVRLALFAEMMKGKPSADSWERLPQSN
jgi:hypothetical protein